MVCATGPVFGGAVDWPTLGFTQIVTNLFAKPTSITHAGDGSQRIFVEEQKGRIWIIQSNAVLAQPFLDITNRVLSAGGEQGLLGLAFPAGYSTNGHFYVDYTRQTDGAVVVSRFQLSSNSNVADTNSEQIVLVIPKPLSLGKPLNNHNGGQLAFGPDGYLYIGVGDGGSEGDPQNLGQNTGRPFGKLLRIDVESGVSPYAIPPNNPFVGNTNYVPETWAFGLRNPWRFSFDRQTGDLYIGDVGQNFFEEIDFQPAGSAGGQNYGWRIMEGTNNYKVPPGFTNFSALTPPVAWYSHNILPTDGGGAVISGNVYRGPSEPRMDGVYFYGDFVVGWIWGLKQTGTNWQSLTLLSPGFTPSHFWISTFGEDDQGRLYMADYYQGKIYQIQDSHQVWTPRFSPANGIINSNTVVVTCVTTNAEIHYTTNGVDPTLSDPIVPPGGIIQVSNGATNKIKAFRPDLTPSSVASAVFTLRVGTPIFNPPAGLITNNTSVSISTVTSAATIYYTTNGTTPTTNSLVYSGPFALSGGSTVMAVGVADGYSNSLAASASYSAAQVAMPTFAPSSGPITNGTSISMSCATPGAAIYYTLDGTAPTTNSSLFASPFTINGGTTVNAFAVASGYVNSPVRGVIYSLVQTATPVFSPATGPVSYGTTVSISCSTPGAAIYYTLDGSSPTTNSASYSGPLTITGDVTLSAFAVAPGHLDSTVQSTLYTLPQAGIPIFNPALGPLTNGTLISITSATTNAMIRYTLDGSNPNTNSAIYSTPLTFTNQITLTAQAFRNDLDPSGTQSAFYGLIDPERTVVTTIAGSQTAGYSNAVGPLARFSNPQGICLDGAGGLYVADTGNNVIRRISSLGQVSTIAGTGVAGSQLGPATNAQFNYPTGVCIDSVGNLYIADSVNCNRVCKMDTNGIVSLLAEVRPCYYGPGLAQLVADPAGNIYVGSWATVELINPNGTVVQLAGSGLSCYYGWCAHVGPAIDAATNIYAATEYKVWKIAPSGSVDLFSGNGAGYSDGQRALALFQGPQDTAVDSATNIFVSDIMSVRKIRPDGWVSTLAGTGTAGYVNGPGSVAQFNIAIGLCVDTNGNVYVADYGNNCIRQISPDTYGIGIPDWWQRAHFGHVGIDPNADPDHDGMNNYAEFWAGTDPLDPKSVLIINSVSIVTNGLTQITWQSVPGKSYAVKYSSDFSTWNTLSNPVQGSSTNLSVVDPTPVAQVPQRFYRVFVNF